MDMLKFIILQITLVYIAASFTSCGPYPVFKSSQSDDKANSPDLSQGIPPEGELLRPVEFNEGVLTGRVSQAELERAWNRKLFTGFSDGDNRPHRFLSTNGLLSGLVDVRSANDYLAAKRAGAETIDTAGMESEQWVLATLGPLTYLKRGIAPIMRNPLNFSDLPSELLRDPNDTDGRQDEDIKIHPTIGGLLEAGLLEDMRRKDPLQWIFTYDVMVHHLTLKARGVDVDQDGTEDFLVTLFSEYDGGTLSYLQNLIISPGSMENLPKIKHWDALEELVNIKSGK